MLLRDAELKKLAQAGTALNGLPVPADWDSKDSPIQPCSVDLHIGGIYVPGAKPGRPGSAQNPRLHVKLKTGQTAIIVTAETVTLPADIAAVGFPPSHVSGKGLLMTNPGHVDPGYSGQLRFTVINMAREDYRLDSGDMIVTVLLFKLERGVDKDYAARFGLGTHVTQDEIDVLSPDFLDVERRATAIARGTLLTATAVGSVLIVLLTFVANAVEKRYSGVEDVKTDVAVLKGRLDMLDKKIDERAPAINLADLDRRLKAIEMQKNVRRP
jgi:dCTP deaminase